MRYVRRKIFAILDEGNLNQPALGFIQAESDFEIS
jgi:hypothetical protein